MQTKLYTKHGTILIKTPKQCNVIFITDQSDLMTIYLHLRIWYSCILVYKRMIIMWLLVKVCTQGSSLTQSFCIISIGRNNHGYYVFSIRFVWNTNSWRHSFGMFSSKVCVFNTDKFNDREIFESWTHSKWLMCV